MRSSAQSISSHVTQSIAGDLGTCLCAIAVHFGKSFKVALMGAWLAVLARPWQAKSVPIRRMS